LAPLRTGRQTETSGLERSTANESTTTQMIGDQQESLTPSVGVRLTMSSDELRDRLVGEDAEDVGENPTPRAMRDPHPSQCRFTVVVPAHNVASVLADQLVALCEQEYDGDWDVVLVDNRSTDETVGIARPFTERLRLTIVSATDRASAAHARNVGIGASSGEWIVFVDGDDVAEPGLLSAYARATHDYRVLGGHLDERSLNDDVVASWRYPLTDHALPVALGRFPYVVTSNCAVRRDVFDEIGLFDEDLEYVGEDVDFSVRAALAGIDIGWVPDARVKYRHRESLRALVRQQFVYGRGSVVLFDRYRNYADPRPLATSLAQIGRVVLGASNLVRGRRRRGQWLRFASFVAGQVLESITRRTRYF
jgi:glycosyltransferase involved in cell wall biosynthesis